MLRSLQMKKYLAFLTFCLFPWVLLGNEPLPDLGDPSARVLTPQEERRLGENIMHQIRNTLPLAEDLWVQNAIQRLGDRLSTTQTDSSFPYQFFVVQDKSINAFALPGGFIGVNTGLILAVADEHELASVLAHEMAHVSQHHIARLYEHAQQIQLSTLAGAVASIIIATQNPNLGSGAIAATMAGQQQAFLNFSRDNEREADRIGMQTLEQAGFDPQAMPRFFEKLWQSTQYYGRKMPEFLQTHPLTEARIADSRGRANQYPTHPLHHDPEFIFLQARVRANGFNTPQEGREYFSKIQPSASATYGLAMCALNQGDGKTAQALLKPLTAQYPERLLIQSTYAESLSNSGEMPEAMALLREALRQYPADLALTLQYNENLLSQKAAPQVISNCREYGLQFGETPETLQLISKAYAALGQPAEMHFSQASFLMAMGDYREALTQLQQAKKLTPTPSKLLLQIDARIEEVKNRIEQLEGKPFKEALRFAF